MIIRKKKRTDDEDAHGLVERTIRALDRLGRGPATPKELAAEFKLSTRQLQRFMKRLDKAGVPVYLRRAASGRELHWWLDVDKYLARFTK